MSLDVVAKVKELYLSNEVSRIMPGIKDAKSVVIPDAENEKL